MAQSTDADPQCLGSRRSRVRCSPETPQCGKCASRGLICTGDAPRKPLRWKIPLNATAFEAKRKMTKDKKGAVINSHPTLCLNPERSSSIEYEIIYYNERVAPGLVVVDSLANPFRWQIGVTAETAYLDYAHAAMSAFHRIVQRRSRYLNKDLLPERLGTSKNLTLSFDPEEARFCDYRAAAVRGLNDALRKTTKSISVAALMGAMVFLFAQLQQGAHGHWRVHLDGLKTLINHYGGYNLLLNESRHAGSVASSVMVVDVISMTTCPVTMMTPDTMKWQLAYLEELPQIDYDKSPTPVQIPQNLMKAIMMVNVARSRSRYTAWHIHVPRFTLSQTIAELDAENASIRVTKRSLPAEDDPRTSYGYTVFVSCFRSAGFLYAIEGYNSINDHQDISLMPSAIQGVRSSAYASLMHMLRELFRLRANSNFDGGYWKFVLWPLVIAGAENVKLWRNQEDHEFICDTLYEMATDLGALAPHDAAVFLSCLWKKSFASGGDYLQGTWDDIFVDAPLFLL